MAADQDHNLNQQTKKPEYIDHPRQAFLWWFVWIPAIIVVILWIGGWTFGNYGGPWSSKPKAEQPRISDPLPS
jgi:hypothetical protein